MVMGLHVPSQMGITHLIVDAKVIVDLMLSNNTSNRAYTPLLNDCKYLLSHFQCYKINHVYQEVNRCADLLAKEACSCSTIFAILDNLSLVSLYGTLDSDASGLYSLKLSASTLLVLSIWFQWISLLTKKKVYCDRVPYDNIYIKSN